VITPPQVSPIAVAERNPRFGSGIENDVGVVVVEQDDYHIVVARDNSFEVVVDLSSFLRVFRLIWELLVEFEMAERGRRRTLLPCS